jgi:hypothetical protein
MVDIRALGGDNGRGRDTFKSQHSLQMLRQYPSPQVPKSLWISIIRGWQAKLGVTANLRHFSLLPEVPGNRRGL